MPGIILPNPLGKDLLILTAHPAGVASLAEQQWVLAQQAFTDPLQDAQGLNALVIGSTSFGYGSATTMALRAAGFSNIIGIGFEAAPQLQEDRVKRSSAGWFLTDAMHRLGVVNTTYLADAFADATRERVFQDLVANNQKIDLLVYSLAAPARTHNGQTWRSTLKVIGEPLPVVALDYDMLKFKGATLKAKTVDAATPEEIDNTVRVMGGDDLNLWVGGLLAHGLLNPGAVVTARTYIGPEGFSELRRLYWDGTIGAAKKDIDRVTRALNERLQREIDGRAYSEVDPAVVTVASAQIPAIAKYLASYLAAMDQGAGIYNDPLQVAINLVKSLYGPEQRWKGLVDPEGRLRLDGDELAGPLQEAIRGVWDKNSQPGDISGEMQRGLDLYRARYLQLFGFGVVGVDYAAPANFDVQLSLERGVVNLIQAPEKKAVPAPVPVTSGVVEATTPAREDETRRMSAVESYFSALLSRGNEPGVLKMEETDKTVYVSRHTFDPERVNLYAEVTNQPQDGTVPSAYTFVISFANTLDAIKDILRAAPKKSVVHAAEEIAMLATIPAKGTVTVRSWLANEKGKRGEGPVMAFVNREIVGADGTLLATGRTTLLIGQDLSQLPATAAKPSDLEGELLSTVTMTQDWINRYRDASGDDNPIHISPEVARELGLSSTIAHGVLTLGLSNRENALAYKAAWKTPVAPGDVIEFRRSGKKIVGIKTTPTGEKQIAIELTPKVGA